MATLCNDRSPTAADFGFHPRGGDLGTYRCIPITLVRHRATGADAYHALDGWYPTLADAKAAIDAFAVEANRWRTKPREPDSDALCDRAQAELDAIQAEREAAAWKNVAHVLERLRAEQREGDAA